MGFKDRVRDALKDLSSPNMGGEVTAVAPWYKPGSVAVAGATLAIPTTNGFVSKTTGGVEALTLADGEPGQMLTIHLVTDGGTGTLTPATATGWATCVFADVKDTLTVQYIDDSIGWIVVGAIGVAAPPVLT